MRHVRQKLALGAAGCFNSMVSLLQLEILRAKLFLELLSTGDIAHRGKYDALPLRGRGIADQPFAGTVLREKPQFQVPHLSTRSQALVSTDHQIAIFRMDEFDPWPGAHFCRAEPEPPFP